MGKQATSGSQPSKVVWDNLEEWVRKKVQEFIQSLLEEEVTELLGRKKSERQKAVDGSPGYRNGYDKERKLTLGCGTITLRWPRVRGLLERFESRVLPLFARWAKGVNKLIPQLYLHGLALGDFDLALRGLLGEAKDGCSQTLQESGERHGGHLEDITAGGTEIPQARCAEEIDAGLPGIQRPENE